MQRAARVEVKQQFAQLFVERQQLGNLHHRLQIERIGSE